ncbi:hypothetical protein ZOSMA_583G00010 [Zostera marina]|uniref:Smr domain-containing protein n=1 Tax=Zostera marina TaxID=29655 RepID=A0A0K9NXL6_ZOSMR|nr:hypothetical protein ZOSMA_583G00010 [Zostera marina]
MADAIQHLIRDIRECDLNSDIDIYEICRKEAIEMSRKASWHSKLAKYFDKRGDNLSKKNHLAIAWKNWEDAGILHAKAAQKILDFKNKDNNEWVLDLHGLHAREAEDALKERLSLVEGLKIQKELLVITGIGKLSKGKAILPNTIRNFLIQNRIRLAR